MKHSMSKLIVVLLAAMLLAATGCDLSLDQDDTGSLAIRLGAELGVGA
jgi:hypothetical protein